MLKNLIGRLRKPLAVVGLVAGLAMGTAPVAHADTFSFSYNGSGISFSAVITAILAPDGSGYGTSYVECNARNATAADSGSWRNATVLSDYPNAWVRLQRIGTVLTAYASSDGNTWTLLATQDPRTVGAATALPATVYVGISTTAHNNDVEGATEFLYYSQSEYADYNSNYAPVANAATLTATTSGGNLVISWTPAGGHLQSSTALGGSWTDAGTANPATIPMTGAAKFFRVVNP